MPTPRVYVVQKSRGLDFTPAKEEFSPDQELIFVLPGFVQMYDDASVEEIRDTIETNMYDFSANDYLVLCGDPIAMVVVYAEAQFCTGGSVNVLKFDRRKNRYKAIEVKFPPLEED